MRDYGRLWTGIRFASESELVSDGGCIRKELSPLSGSSEAWRGMEYRLPHVPVLWSFRCARSAVVALKFACVGVWSAIVLVRVGAAPDT